MEIYLNPLSASVVLILKLICTAIELTGFYMRATLALNGLTSTISIRNRGTVRFGLDL